MANKQPLEFHEYLFHTRTGLGMTVREAARRIGISHSRLLDFEQGFDQHTRRPCVPSLATLLKMASAYSINFGELATRAGFELPLPVLTAEEEILLNAFRAASPSRREQVMEILTQPS